MKFTHLFSGKSKLGYVYKHHFQSHLISQHNVNVEWYTAPFFWFKTFLERFPFISIFICNNVVLFFLLGAIGEDNIAENMVENTDDDVVYEGDEDGEDSVTEAVSYRQRI